MRAPAAALRLPRSLAVGMGQHGQALRKCQMAARLAWARARAQALWPIKKFDQTVRYLVSCPSGWRSVRRPARTSPRAVRFRSAGRSLGVRLRCRCALDRKCAVMGEVMNRKITIEDFLQAQAAPVRPRHRRTRRSAPCRRRSWWPWSGACSRFIGSSQLQQAEAADQPEDPADDKKRRDDDNLPCALTRSRRRAA